MISEESRDTKNWSNDCWKLNFAIIGKKYNLNIFKKKTVI